MNVGSILRLEVISSSENFDKKSMAFYGHTRVDDMAWLMSHQEILLVHTNMDTKEQRKMVVRGMSVFNKLREVTYNDKTLLVYRY